MRATPTFAAIRRLAPVLLGARGASWLALSTGAWLVQGLVEWAMAALLLLFLHSVALVDRAALPRWIPESAYALDALSIWGVILAAAVGQSALQVLSYQGRVLVAERAHARLRMLLAWRVVVRDARPPSLSRMTALTSEIFPRAVAFLFHATQVACFSILGIALTVAMFAVAAGAASVALAGIVAFGLLVLRLNRANNRAAARLTEHQADYERAKVRLARNWLLVRALGLEREECASQLEASARTYRATVRAFFFGNLGNALGPVLAALLLAAVVVVHVVWLRNPAAELVAFLYLLFRLQQMLANGSHVVGGLFTYGPHVVEAERFVFELTGEERARALAVDAAFGTFVDPGRVRDVIAATIAAGDAFPPPRPPALRGRGLAFRWPASSAAVFADLDFDVEPGRMLGIAGPNGAGKSTLLAILLGTIEPSEGTLEIDGVDRAVWMARHRSAVGFVGAEPYLVLGTIRENLVYGLRHPAEEAEIERVLALVGLARLGNGSAAAHVVEEGGEGLSAGEKQKLAIARALLRHPRLLVLDEPTAHVDERSEEEIVGTLLRLRGECTIVLVSHQPRVLRRADRVLRLGAGSAAPVPIVNEEWPASPA